MLQLPFGLRPKEQGLDEIISRTDAYPVEYGLSGDVHPEARDILKQVNISLFSVHVVVV